MFTITVTCGLIILHKRFLTDKVKPCHLVYKSNSYIIHINIYISGDSDILVYNLSELLGKYKHTRISKEIIDTMSQPFRHTSHPNLWGIPIYEYSQTWYLRKSNGYNITALHAYNYSELSGNTSIRALPILNRKENI
jgi:hypothetical protein